MKTFQFIAKKEKTRVITISATNQQEAFKKMRNLAENKEEQLWSFQNLIFRTYGKVKSQPTEFSLFYEE